VAVISFTGGSDVALLGLDSRKEGRMDGWVLLRDVVEL
jgi:hypothetical protein